MDKKKPLFDIENKICDETEADKDKLEGGLRDVDYDFAVEIFNEDMMNAAAAYDSSTPTVRNRDCEEEKTL